MQTRRDEPDVPGHGQHSRADSRGPTPGGHQDGRTGGARHAQLRTVKVLLFVLVAATTLALDQTSKHWAQSDLQHRKNASISVIEGSLSLTYVRNPAGAWGLLGGLDKQVRHVVLLSTSLLAVVILAFLVPRGKSLVDLAAMGAVLGGAVGNLLDRLRWHYVVDFVDWHRYIKWPTFNLADVAITVGVILLAAGMLRNELSRSTSDDAPSSEVPADFRDKPSETP
ncbi:MAG: signal peptidase II [Deltaproteobacteria bacterium]|nr:signal peptidase II [Deltaproteobacteria bacterium]